MKKILLPMLAATMMFTACENEQDVALEQTQQKGVTFTVPDFQNGENTRMAVDINASGANFTWTEGDTLGVFPSNGYQTAFPISGGAGTNTAVFDGADWALRPNASYAAYYPFIPSMQLNKSKIEVSYLGQTQNGNGSTAHLGAYDYLGAKYTEVNAAGNVNFQMSHLGCLVRFQLTMPEADTYTSMTLSCDGANFATTNKFDLTAATPALTAKSTASSISLALTNVATTEANQVLTLYMMLPPIDLSSKELSLSVLGKERYKTTIAGKNMLVGKSYQYSNTMSALATKHNGHAYVDLGITDDNGYPIYWATYNVGASSPEEYGNYYAWGMTNTMSSYNMNAYPYYNVTKQTATYYCQEDKKIVIEPSDDAATVNWGGSWRVPTLAELKKLNQGCYWEWTDNYNNSGIAGFIAYKAKAVSDKGKKKYRNGSVSITGSYALTDTHIFLPAAGYYQGSYLEEVEEAGLYMSSSLTIYQECETSQDLYFMTSYFTTNSYERSYGRSVRPVYLPNEVKATSISLSSSTLSLKVDGPTATLSASVSPSNVTNANICWVSSNSNVAYVSNGVVTPVDAGSCTITAITMDGTNLNASCSVTVKAAGPDANGHAYVDLGITDDNGNPIYWATCNLGASSPEEYGNYYAWGETKAYGEEDTSNATNYSYTSGQGSATYTKTYYNWSTYKYCNGSYSTQTKYCTNRNYGTVDNKTVLESADDAATANWGGNWRMPTDAELTKLRTKCTWTWTTQNSNKGYKVTGSNGNSIFLPAAGCRFESSLFDDGFYGFYGSSSLFSEDDDAYNLKFHLGYVFRGNNDRYCGQSIRPVCQ